MLVRRARARVTKSTHRENEEYETARECIEELQDIGRHRELDGMSNPDPALRNAKTTVETRILIVTAERPRCLR